MASSDGGGIGTSLGGMEYSPDRKKRDAAKRKRQEKRWASRSGEVKIIRAESEPSTEEQAADADD